jgi:hypothetical protein
MKNRFKQQYVQAIMPIIESRCMGRSMPICLDARQLLEEACKRSCLIHSYAGNESYRVVRDLFDEIDRQCKAHEQNDVFPVAVIKCTSRIVKTIGHGRELVINDKTTSAFYESNAYASRSDGFTGFVLFGRQVTTRHPILIKSYAPRRKAIQTEVMRHDQKVEYWQSCGLISKDQAEVEMIGINPNSVPLLGG